MPDASNGRLVVHITPEYEPQVKKLKAIAEKEVRSVSYLVRMAIDMFIEKYEEEKGAVDDGTEG